MDEDCLKRVHHQVQILDDAVDLLIHEGDLVVLVHEVGGNRLGLA